MHPSEDSTGQPPGQAVIVDADGFPALFEALRGRGYTVVGPTVRDGAIVVAELTSIAELPFGWGVETEAGRYRLRERSDTAAFGHSAGPQSWKSSRGRVHGAGRDVFLLLDGLRSRPTCFCTTTEDVTDLTGDHAERWRRWDSCYDLDFSYLHGGSVRTSGQSRYRQWIRRCIVWCPAGIDITQEVAALASLQEEE